MASAEAEVIRGGGDAVRLRLNFSKHLIKYLNIVITTIQAINEHISPLLVAKFH